MVSNRTDAAGKFPRQERRGCYTVGKGENRNCRGVPGFHGRLTEGMTSIYPKRFRRNVAARVDLYRGVGRERYVQYRTGGGDSWRGLPRL